MHMVKPSRSFKASRPQGVRAGDNATRMVSYLTIRTEITSDGDAVPVHRPLESVCVVT